MPVIDCTQLNKSFSGRAILAGVTLTIRTGEHVGLVGNSGSGKSTLGRILAGLDESDDGNIAIRRGARIDYLEQEPTFDEGKSASEVVLESLADWTRARQRYDSLTARLSDAADAHSGDIEKWVHEQSAAAEALEREGGWDRLHEVEAVIHNLGINDPTRLIGEMSGGERRRVALARVLVGEPDLAILDEPTNHLDLSAIQWLENHLIERFRGALLLITHDRYILDRVATRTFELSAGAVYSYDGGYAEYLMAKSERQAQAERVESNRQNFLRRELEWFRSQPKARGTKQKARMSRVQSALDQDRPDRERHVDLRTDANRLGKTILQLKGLGLERDGKRLIEHLDLDLRRGDRIGIVGGNGVGKTSLLLCLLDQLEVTDGEWTLGSNSQIGYLDQTRTGLDEGDTVRDAVAGGQEYITIAGEELRVGAYLERFLFDGTDQRKKISVLSGGERARVCLAKLLANRSNLLLLDEPTNDLDVGTLGALEAMLVGFGGSALIVSHDRWFLDRVATSILSFEGEGKVDLHRGNYSEFVERKELEKEAAAQAGGQGAPVRQSDSGASGTGKQEKKKTKLSWAEEKELAGLLDKIDRAEERVSELEARLGDPATYERGREEVASLTRDTDSAREKVASLTTRWEELEEMKAEFAD